MIPQFQSAYQDLEHRARSSAVEGYTCTVELYADETSKRSQADQPIDPRSDLSNVFQEILEQEVFIMDTAAARKRELLHDFLRPGRTRLEVYSRVPASGSSTRFRSFERRGAGETMISTRSTPLHSFTPIARTKKCPPCPHASDSHRPWP